MCKTIYPYPIYPSSRAADGSRIKFLYRKRQPNSYEVYSTYPNHPHMPHPTLGFGGYPPNMMGHNRYPVYFRSGHHRSGSRGYSELRQRFDWLRNRVDNVDNDVSWFHGYLAGQNQMDRNPFINYPTFRSRGRRRRNRSPRDWDGFYEPDDYPFIPRGYVGDDPFNNCK